MDGSGHRVIARDWEIGPESKKRPTPAWEDGIGHAPHSYSPMTIVSGVIKRLARVPFNPTFISTFS